MSIEGRLGREKERLSGMTTEERAWRKQWLKDQVLSPNEPRLINTNTAEYLNIFRRAYRFPLDFVFLKLLRPVLGPEWSLVSRYYVGKGLIGLWGILGTFYYFKYNTNDWTTKGSWRVIRSRNAVYPGEPGFPAVSQKTLPSDYHDRGFKASEFFQKVKQTCSK